MAEVAIDALKGARNEAVASTVKGDKLSELAKKKLGDKQRDLIGLGRVRRVGVQYFDKDNKVKNAWPQVPGTAGGVQLMTFLDEKGISNSSPAYDFEVKVGDVVNFDDGQPAYTVTLGQYHSGRAFGSAPMLKEGETVEIHAEKDGDKLRYLFRKIKQ